MASSWGENNSLHSWIYVVPRLPSCHKEWKDTLKSSVPTYTRNKTGSFECRIDGFLEKMGTWETLEKVVAFRHVGKLMFASLDKAGSMKYRLLEANGPDGKDGDGWEILKMPPKTSGAFIIEHHSHSMYPKVLEKIEKAGAQNV
jgi:hypothetical protein